MTLRGQERQEVVEDVRTEARLRQWWETHFWQGMTCTEPCTEQKVARMAREGKGGAVEDEGTQKNWATWHLEGDQTSCGP